MYRNNKYNSKKQESKIKSKIKTLESTSEVEFIEIQKNNLDNFEVQFDNEWELSEIYDNIYSIKSQNKFLPFVLKIFSEQKYAKREYETLLKYSHLNVPKVMGCYFSKDLNYLILEKISGKDLHDFINENETFSEEELKIIAKQLLIILNEMHQNGDIHKDIKPENILYDSNTKEITLIDFEQKITRSYCSPEILKRQKVDCKTDLWSAGVTFYYLLVGEIPDKCYKEEPKYPKYLSKDCINFLKSLIEEDVEIRYGCEDALEDSFLSDI
jgi:serine/threonine protein kinase